MKDYPFAADPIQPSSTAANGRRPEFLDDPMTERLYGITLALTAELAVTRERLDTVERLLAERGVLPGEDIETYKPRADAAAARAQQQQDYLARVFRVLLQEGQGLAAR